MRNHIAEMLEEIARQSARQAEPRVWVKRPPWWRPFARRRFDRQFPRTAFPLLGRVIIVPSPRAPHELN